MTQLTGMTPHSTRGVLARNRMATRTLERKKQQESRVFFNDIFDTGSLLSGHLLKSQKSLPLL